jgi:hypothetical protein
MAQLKHSDDHNTVIKKYSELIAKSNPNKFGIQTLFSEGKSVEVAGIIPDILLLNEEGSVLTAIEVETVSSVGSDTSTERWKQISGSVAEFQILLPKGTQARANRICKKLGIKARLQEY